MATMFIMLPTFGGAALAWAGVMGAEVIHDDDVAGPQGWQEYLFDIGLERRAVDRTNEGAWGGEPIATQRPQEGLLPGEA